MTKKIILFSAIDSPRTRYIFDIILADWMGLELEWVVNEKEFAEANGAKLAYGFNFSGALTIPQHTFLESGIEETPAIEWVDISGKPAFFGVTAPTYTYQFDLVSFVFYFLSRFEEYENGARDKYGRFASVHSRTRKWVSLPLVDIWTNHLAEVLQKQFPDLKLTKLPFVFEPTYDIDVAFAFANRKTIRKWGAIAKDVFRGNLDRLRMRRSVLKGVSSDPFDTYDFLLNLDSKFGTKAKFFFLFGSYGGLDRNVYLSEAYKKVIRHLSRNANTGIHLSTKASRNIEVAKSEIQVLEEVTTQKVDSNRFHFLLLRLPESYRMLIELGITDDYSMGYHDVPGFRAGTSRPFKWYDLQKEEQTSLIVHPFQAMDASFDRYLEIARNDALDELMKLSQVIFENGGHFSCIWHNSSFTDMDDQKDWTQLYSVFMRKMYRLTNGK